MQGFARQPETARCFERESKNYFTRENDRLAAPHLGGTALPPAACPTHDVVARSNSFTARFVFASLRKSFEFSD